MMMNDRGRLPTPTRIETLKWLSPLEYNEDTTMTTTFNKTQLIEMFADNTAGESYHHNRLVTRETDGGNVALIAYGWLKLAEYNESREAITLFTGHKSLKSTAVSRYINDVRRVAGERRTIIRSGESPTVNKPNAGTRYIGEYIDFSGGLSAVEKNALDLVRDSLRFLDN